MDVIWKPDTGLPIVGGSSSRAPKNESSVVLNKLPAAPSFWEREKRQGKGDGLLIPPLDRRKLMKSEKNNVKETAGSKWFGMGAPTLTPELKRELQLLRLRGALDPKRHYKASDSKAVPKFFQIGTVVEGAADFYSGRLTKKERKLTFADELLADSSLRSYRKRKYMQIQEQKEAGGKKFWKKKKNRQKPTWAKD